MYTDRIGPGAVVDGRFEIDRLANAGGMGEVFRAVDRRSGAPVAVKFLRNGEETHLSRFEREAQALAQLEHPGIVRYVAHGAEPAVFLAMEWLEGEDLSRRLARGPLSAADTLVVAKGVADALSAAHARGIIHRDIKPSNIFLCDGRVDTPKVLDFGVAQITQSSRAITQTGQLLGTIGYMAPEQALSGKDITPAVDVYSLGCVLFECLTGEPPFSGEWPQVLTKILASDPPRLRDVRKNAPLVLDELVSRMHRRHPESRASLATVAGDIATLLTSGELLTECRSSTTVPAVTGDERRLLASILVVEPEGDVRPIAETFGADRTPLSGHREMITLSAGVGEADLATRAARCALALRDATGDTGRIALAIGRGDPLSRTLISEMLERATRLVDEPLDSRLVRIDPMTAGLLDAAFVVDGVGSTLVLAREREASDPRLLLGKPTPFVGRERDLATIEGLVSECLDESLSTALLVTGNPGVGKSRVRQEVVRAIRARPDAPEIWTARGDPIAVGSPYGMLAQIVRRMAGLDESELVEVRRQKLLARVGRHLPISDAIRVAEILGEIVGAQFAADDRPALRVAREDPVSLTDQLRRAWEDLVGAETAAGALVVVLEDLQWGDLPTIRLIDAALRSQRHRPLLVLSVARPEVHDAFPGLFRDRRVHEVRIGELMPSAARRLVFEVLGPGTDPDVANALVERSHGNAFYLEELIRGVAEGEVALPETVLATAQARLQRLEPGARRLLRAASVFGARFWLSGVAALVKGDAASDVRPALEALVQREVVTREPSSRFRGEEEYSFRQALLREAAYEMLIDRDRQQAHALAAEWLEARGERDALVVAEHLERAGERQRAVIWYLWAAEQALEANDLASVLLRAERGAQCGATGSVLGELTLLKAEASGWAGVDTHRTLAERALEELAPGSSAWTRAAAELSVACRATGDVARLRSIARRVAEVSPDAPSIAHAWARARMALELLEEGETELAERLVTSLAPLAADADESDRALVATLAGWLRGSIGTSEAAAKFERSGSARWVALVALRAARHEKQWAERACELAGRLGLRSCEVRARAWLAYHLAESGHLEAARTTAESAVRDAPGDRVAETDAAWVMSHVQSMKRREHG